MAADRYTLRGLHRTINKRVPTDDGRGFTTRPDGSEMGDVELSVDLEALARMLGMKALRNKTGRASMAGGLIKIKVVGRRRYEAKP